jgi:hypothetical protein
MGDTVIEFDVCSACLSALSAQNANVALDQ